ncbi:MAG: alcohol acetyltransferase [Anaerovoracaceae bacterium]
MKAWYKLDVAANLFPSVTSNKNSSVFRVATVLTEPVDSIVLQKAVNAIMPRYPIFFMKLRKGFFWNYLESQDSTFTVTEEKDYPCADMNPLDNNGFLIKILYYNNRISVEFFHAITDGVAAGEFVKSLIYYYICNKYGQIDAEAKILLANENTIESTEDSFSEHFDNKEKKTKIHMKKKQDTAHRIRGNFYKYYGHNVITGVLSAKELNAKAKEKDTTITSLLVAQLIYSIYKTESQKGRIVRPIVIAMPVNLRKVFSSKSLRNFFAVVNLSYKVESGTTFNQIVESVTKQIKKFTLADNLTKIAARNVTLSKNPLSKAVPLVMKDALLSFGFKHYTETKKTMTISNFGNILIPSGMEKYIEYFESFLYPTKKSPISVSVLSVNDRLTINFAKTIIETEIIQDFFESLSKKENIVIRVYSNNWEEQNE